MFRLDEDHEELRALAREIATEQVAPHAAAVDAEGRFPRESVEALTRAGLHAIGIPEQYGGQGASLLGSAVVAEEIARACTTTQQVIGGNELFTWPLLLGGSEEVKQRYLTRIAAGECLGAFALSEPEAGSDVAAMTTQARREGDHYVLKGTKRWITNAGEAGLYVVFAVTDPQAGARGISAFVLEATDEGIELGGLERKMGLKGSPTREVVMRDVRIPADRIVGEEGQGLRLALGTLDRTRAIVAAQAVGVAQGALDVAVRYARERRQFGRPIGEFQGVAFMLADMEMRLRAARLLTYAAAEEAEAAGPDMSVAGATAKCFASDAAMAITVDAVQVLGGAGYTADFPVERMMRDAKITQIYEGTNQVQRIVVSRALLGAR
ncbi:MULTISPECIES: acyl-CoA dehydrogenase family protein [Arsenicicoccus]|uniref:acyl-CoA dehydrogenase family protein n=1 Tax=Arsenicicoccus TaxID=267408 RepID=UPI00257E0494|nr:MULTISPECIES: acyl-CoA dehydrogenase family protein [Arsenicicoccus]